MDSSDNSAINLQTTSLRSRGFRASSLRQSIRLEMLATQAVRRWIEAVCKQCIPNEASNSFALCMFPCALNDETDRKSTDAICWRNNLSCDARYFECEYRCFLSRYYFLFVIRQISIIYINIRAHQGHQYKGKVQFLLLDYWCRRSLQKLIL